MRPEQEAPPLRCFHVTRGVKRQALPTGFQSVESVQSVDPSAFSRVRLPQEAMEDGATSVFVSQVGIASRKDAKTQRGKGGCLASFGPGLFSLNGATQDSPGHSPAVP
jgi:hypothetical protein